MLIFLLYTTKSRVDNAQVKKLSSIIDTDKKRYYTKKSIKN